MNIDLSRLASPQKESAQNILELLNEIEAAYAEDKQRANAICKEKKASITDLVTKLTDMSPEEQTEIGKLPNRSWLSACFKILAEAADPFIPTNEFDRQFLEVIKTIRKTGYADLFKIIWQSVCNLKEQSEETYHKNFVSYFAKYPLWGSFDPDRRDYDTLKRRAAVLKEHSYDFVWLYKKFPDYLSKYTLTAILRNWLYLDTMTIYKVRSIFPDYYEPDIFPGNKDDIFVDIGAYIGDSILNYVNTYGNEYKKIYAYEITKDSCEVMRDNLKDLHDVEIRRKGAGDAPGEMFLSTSSADPSANQLSANSSGDRVEIVKLDDDIPEGFTFLKMDIEGAEYSALMGAEQTIRRCHPKLAICVYHGYDDLWRIPGLIDSFDPNYTFYLRHNGGNIIPTEFVLLCKPNS